MMLAFVLFLHFPTYLFIALSDPNLQPTAIEDPKTLVDLYRNGAVNAKEAGFDGVERK